MYERATRIEPNSRAPWFNLGNMYKEDHQTAKAERAYLRALELEPGNASTMMALGSIKYDARLNEEAETWFRRAVAAAPSDPEVLYNVANNLKELGRYEAAIGVYDDAEHVLTDLSIAESNTLLKNRRLLLPRIRFERFFAKNFVCDWRNRRRELGQLRQYIADDAGGKDEPRIIPFQAISYPLSGPELLKAARRFAEGDMANIRGHFEGGGAAPLANPTQPAPGKRLRIGYMSADFNDHPVSEDMQSVYELHDRDRFEVFAFSLHEPSPSERDVMTAGLKRDYRAHIQATVDHYVSLVGMTDVEAAEAISSRGIHILIDLNGYTRGQRMPIFAARPAPVQVSYKGYAGTTGSPYLDYYVSDPIVSPPVLQKMQFSEKVVSLPDQFFVNDFRQGFPEVLDARRTRRPRAEYGLPATGFLFCNFNKLFKVDPAVFVAWTKILRAVPGAHLWLLDFPAEALRNLRRYAAALGVGDERRRIVSTPLFKKAEHLVAKSHCDLFLDTFQYNAHGTAAEAMWAGVPVLTFPGPKMTARVAASLAANCNSTATVVGSVDEYVARATDLALGHIRYHNDNVNIDVNNNNNDNNNNDNNENVNNHHNHEEDDDEDHEGKKRKHLMKRGKSELAMIREGLESARTTCATFDTPRWVRNFERSLEGMWEVHSATGKAMALNLGV